MLIKADDSESGIHIDFVPMVDVLFNLLIFFLLATSLKQAEREMQIALPYAASAAPLTTLSREIIINVDEQGGVVVAGKPIELDALRATLEEAVKSNSEQKVTVRGDRRALYDYVTRVLDTCKEAGVNSAYLSTVALE